MEKIINMRLCYLNKTWVTDPFKFVNSRGPEDEVDYLN